MIKRIGFACKWIDRPDQVDGIKTKDDCKKYNTGTTTLAWINRQHKDVAVDKLWTLMKENIEATRLLVDKVGQLHENLRLFRLSSDILPLYTEPNWSWFYKQPDVQTYAARHFGRIGDSARKNNVRLSFHPGQFCCIVSNNLGIVNNSITELEYHADMVKWMGYGNNLLDVKINIHLSGNLGINGFDYAWNKMTPELRNMLTLENDEFQSDIDKILQLKDKVGIVLDLHHHWINSGEYIEASDKRIKMVIESWCRDGTDRRPTFHYSQSSEDVLTNHPNNEFPTIDALIKSGYKKSKLRTHSNFYWNRVVNDWAQQHWEWGDIMAESKGKSLSSFQLFNQFQGYI